MRVPSALHTGRHAGDDDAGRLLDLVRGLAVELHPRRAGSLRVTPDTAFDRELGLGSLAMVELIARVEREFAVRLPDHAIATAGTVRDLLRQMRTAPAPRAGPVPSRADASDSLPDVASATDAVTLVEVLERHAAASPDRVHLVLLESGEELRLSYGALLDEARDTARGLRCAGIEPGDAVALMLPTCRQYFGTFLGIQMAGGVPIPLYPPARPSQLEDHLRRHVAILANSRARALVTVPEAQGMARLLRGHVETLRSVLAPGDLPHSGDGALPAVGPTDIAFLQYTSGSTGSPKGVVVTHQTLLASLRAMGVAAGPGPADVFVSWLPLYHDMGLIGAWIGSLYFGYRLVLMSPLAFLSRPARWLRAIDEHRATLTAAPNFAFELCLAKVTEEDAAGLDLGSLRSVFNGAEPVGAATIRRFHERFAPHGFRSEAMTPVYGLAEACLGLTFPPRGRPPLVDRVRRRQFEASGRALPAAEDERDALSFVGCGRVIADHEIRVVGATGHELPDRRQGRLQFRGPSATSGYFREPEATAQLFDEDWLDTGDLAYVDGGEVYLTGRAKDLVIRGGRNVHPQEIEAAVGAVAGVRTGCVAAFGSTGRDTGTELLVVVAETRIEDPVDRRHLHDLVQAAVTDSVGAPADDVVLAAPQTVLKTSSGKIRRAACRDLYERGKLGAAGRPVWLQITRTMAAALGPSLRRTRRAAADRAYSAYAWLMFCCLAPPTWLAVVLLPRRRWRRRVCRAASRALLALCRIPFEVRGAEHLPRVPCVFVVNHASYVDAFSFLAGLPLDAAFVAKREFLGSFLTRLPLRRLGTAFVERFDFNRGATDARELTDLIRGGESVVFFPEGTFRRGPGLRPFQMGAFVAAAQAGVPLVPVALRGTRHVLRGEQRMVHRSAVRVTVCEPLTPAGTEWHEALRLRDAARSAIGRHCGEPDLGACPSHPPARSSAPDGQPPR